MHESGFLHLDMKPANMFIKYKGFLKIGDFGLTAQCPAARGIGGEGDGEYIEPEILLGKFDKPADI
jgi:mitosis inhibitor protein kinase SWE1